MGGDNAPAIEVEGAIEALRENKDINVILVGIKDKLEKLIHEKLGEKNKTVTSRLSIVNASEVINMSDSPATAHKQKPDASLVVAGKLLKEEKADALVSAGNTGAVMVTALFSVGRIKGIVRPALLAPIPSKKNYTAMLDAGANVDCKPIHLVQFAIMGELYARYILNIEKPLVGLLSVGEEDVKGNELSLATLDLIKKTSLNFKGNVEGRDITNGSVDVVVCDGFVGNAILKLAEGIADLIVNMLKNSIKNLSLRGMLGALLLKPVFSELKKKVSYDEYGGAPLLGVKKPVIITHGSATAKAIKNSIKVAAQFIRRHINEEIEQKIKEYGVIE